MNIIYKNANDSDEILEIDNKILNLLQKCENFDDVNCYDPLYKDMILYLSEYRENVLNWYDFTQDCKILQIGTNFGNIIELLHKKSNCLFSIEPSRKKGEYIYEKYKHLENTSIFNGIIEEIELNEEFDYIILNNSLEFASMYTNQERPAEKLLEYAKKHLKSNGKIIIITNNKFAIKYFIGASDLYNKEPYSNIMGDNNYTNNKYKLFGKNEIIEMIKKVGINKYKFFYSLPENKAINVIFTDEFLPTQETMNKYLPIYNNYDFIRFSEIKAMKQFLLNNTFDLFCNSYIIECSLDDNINDSKFVSFNNPRKKEYRLVTIIKDKNVEKRCISEYSNGHYENFKNNIQKLNKNDKIKVLDYVENEIIKSKFEDFMPLDKVLIEFLKSNNIEEFINQVLKCKKFICDNFEKSNEYNENNIFLKYDIDLSGYDLNKFHFITDGYLDLTFQNILIDNGEYYIFDQEWYEKNVPVEFIIYRGLKIIFSFGGISQLISQEVFEMLQLKEYINLFEELEHKIQININSDSAKKIYSYNYEIENNAEFLLNKSINELIIRNKELEEELNKFKLKKGLTNLLKKGRGN